MENFDLRSKRKLRLFIISYIINNFASGIMYDTYVNYMQEVSKHIAASFWAFYGYATFISAFVILAVPKTGYKKILMLCSLGVGSAFFLAVYADSSFFMGMATLFALTGVQIHFIILAPFVAAYTEGLGDKGIKWYTKAYYMGYVGYFISTYIGGVGDEFFFEIEEKPSPFKVITRSSMNAQNRSCNWSKDRVEEGVYYDFSMDMVPMDYTLRKDHRLALIIYGIDAQQTQRPAERTEINLIRDSIKVKCHICSR